MVHIPRPHLHSENNELEDAHSLGIRTLRHSGGSVVVTIPPEVMSLVDMDCGDDVVIHATNDSITLTRLPAQDNT